MQYSYTSRSSFLEKAVDVIPGDGNLDEIISVDCLRNRLHTFDFLGIPLLAVLEDLFDKLPPSFLVVCVTKMFLDTLSKSVCATSQLFSIVSGKEFLEALY